MNDSANRGEVQHSGVAESAPAAPIPRRTSRGRLFRKYLVLILSLVTIALLASGAISTYFTYQETRAALANLQHEKALAAASRIEQYIRQIEQQLSYAALPQLDPSDTESRRIEFLKLLRQAPEVTDIAQIGPDGREQIAVSRLGMDSANSGKDRSQDPAFVSARRGQAWFGPVYFRKETEPYMTIAIRAGGDKGPVTVADVNLKFIWDVVSRIKIGDKGKAYVVDGNGFLIADPDIGLVLRKTDLSRLGHVKAALENKRPDETAMVSTDLAGSRVLTAVVPIETLKWSVFVEQPVSEVYEKLNAAILRTGALLLVGLVISAVGALALARRMVRPIRILEEGAQRIGAGELDQKIEVHTGDELEALANRFNRMSSQLKESYAGLERKVEERTGELTESLEYQTAISAVLRVISESPTDVTPVFEAIMESATRLFDSPFAAVFRYDGELVHLVSTHNWSPEAIGDARRLYPAHPNPQMMSGRVILTRTVQRLEDTLLDPSYDQTAAMLGHWRRMIGAPMLKDGEPMGALVVAWPDPGTIPQRQADLLKTFASQAAIAIDNVRLFNETKNSLEQQTAISEILRVISSSPTDVQPVLDAVAERAAHLCDTPFARVFLIDGNSLVPRAYYSTGGTRALVPASPLPLRRTSVSGRATLDRETIHVPDIVPLLDTEYPDARPNVEQTGQRTTLAVPLTREGGAYGAILLYRLEHRPFSPDQIALVETFASQAAIAIDNVRLFNQTKEALEQQTAISEILRVITSSPTDVKPVLDAIAERAAYLCDASVASMYLTEGSVLKHLASKGSEATPTAPVYALPINRESLSGRAVLERRTIQVADILAEGAEYPVSLELAQRHGERTVLVTPLYREGQPFGTILLRRREVRPFSEREIALLQTFGDQAAIALEHVRLFNEIEDKSRQLEIANKHKSEFLANMSHELRTPLNAIIGFSEVLLERLFGDLNEKQDDYLKDIHSSGRHLLTLINDILDLSKVEAGRMDLEISTFDLPNAIANAMTLVRERAQQHGIRLGQEVDAHLGEITADERKFKQILLNLLSNAVKFTPDGGRIDVTARREADAIAVAVRDTGIGIAPADQQAVFEEFRQVGRNYTNKHEGTGLGLALTKRFVELHGGRIWLESEPGNGSTFTFTIPTQR